MSFKKSSRILSPKEIAAAPRHVKADETVAERDGKCRPTLVFPRFPLALTAPLSSPETAQNSVKKVGIRNGGSVRLGADLTFDGVSPRDPGMPGPHQAHR